MGITIGLANPLWILWWKAGVCGGLQGTLRRWGMESYKLFSGSGGVAQDGGDIV